MGGEKAAVAEGERTQFLPAAVAPGSSILPAAGSAPAPNVAAGPSAILVRQLSAVRLSQALASEAARGATFLCLPVLMAAGAAFYFALSREPGWLALALPVAFLAISTWLLRTRAALSLIFGAFLVFMLGIAVAKLETSRLATPMVGSDVTTRITGRLVRLEHQSSGRIRLTIDLLATERPRLHYPPKRVRLTARAVPPDLRPGDGVAGLTRLMSPSGPVRPGAYDFSFASYFNRLGAVGFFMSGPERVELDEPLPVSARPARWLETARGALAERIRAQVGGVEGEVAVAMIAGFRAGIPEEINEWLRRAGLAHILAISGLHMALVAVTIMFMLRAGAALFPGFSSRFAVKKYAAVAALLMCTLYLFVSGSAVAAQRSYIMLAVMLAALIFDRAAITMRNVAIAALIILVLSPHEVVGPSFQMSFAATAALVAGYAAWTDWRQRRARSGPPPGGILSRVARYGVAFVLGLAATSLIAGTATALYGIWHFQRATPLALPANLAAMPVVSILAMPAAVLAMLAMPFGLDGIFLKVMGQAIAVVIAVAEWFSSHTPIDAVGLIPLSALLTLTAALVVLVVSTTRLRLLALPLIVLGLCFVATRQLPDVLVTEDARLVGLRGLDGRLAVNRSRPNGFTMEGWTRALKAQAVVKPTGGGEGFPDISATSQAGFSCGDGLCLARHSSGTVIAHAAGVTAARAACGAAALIVLDDAVAKNPCGADVPVITKRELARRGSAVVYLREEGEPAEILFSIEEPWRPWHAHRAWSRAARGLPPNEPGS
ncbi:ComEC/Rec2 family competence protein [Chelativorans salis]|uniref:ComEC family competence protein n=1 Tax=Chelativorans salis TaxID=2978478 RepID=A0ABT2LPL7_9HYPH|nr:ComEC/Rec2 family competence protein [Chelativorans sp. EGI FJ00035]MCT7375139.1 ComEC family competence protein [Chelativorans sp. EGI FJ00035]